MLSYMFERACIDYFRNNDKNKRIKSQASMSASTPQQNRNSEVISTRQRGRFRSFISRLTPLPRLIRDLFVLWVKVTFVTLVASFRLVVPPAKKSLLGETVLITGAGRGIGRELALQLASHGCIIVCWDTDVDANLATMSVISKDGGEAHGFAVDASERSEVHEAARLMTKAGIPEVTILINNATLFVHQPFLEHKAEDIQRMFDVNVLSQFWTIQTFLPSMLRNNKGHIVSICSMAGFYGMANEVTYSSTRFAVRGLMEALSEELRLSTKDSKVNLTTVYPFYVDTEPMTTDLMYRSPSIIGSVSPKYAAKEVIRAVQRNYEKCTIPRGLFYLNAVNRVLPDSAARLILDFLGNEGK